MCVKEVVAKRMAENPEKLAREVARRKAKDAIRRPPKGNRKPLTPERKREINRTSKARTRARDIEAARAYARKYYAQNNLKVRIRNRVYKALKQQKLSKKIFVNGCEVNIEAIASYIGPCPGARGDWHIDHVRPLASFDLSDPDQFTRAFAPENHQWLTAQENLMKNCKYG